MRDYSFKKIIFLKKHFFLILEFGDSNQASCEIWLSLKALLWGYTSHVPHLMAKASHMDLHMGRK